MKRNILQILTVFITVILLSVASISISYFLIHNGRIALNVCFIFVPIGFSLLSVGLFIDKHIKKKRKFNIQDQFLFAFWYLPTTFTLFYIFNIFEIFVLYPPDRIEVIVWYLVFGVIMISVSAIFIRYRNREFTRNQWTLYFACNVFFSILFWAFGSLLTLASLFGRGWGGV